MPYLFRRRERATYKACRKSLKAWGNGSDRGFRAREEPLAEMFAVNMLANTDGGNTYTEEQYREWLKDAGFGRIGVIDLDEKERQLITAFKD